MLRQQYIKYCLIYAVREGRLEEAREIINSFGLCYSQAWLKGYNLLCDALKNKHSAVAKLLLTSGSKVNGRYQTQWSSDSPLHLAVINGDTEIVEMLLNKGAEIDVKGNGDKTPLRIAIENKKIEVTELLLKHGAYVNARDKDGTGLLHIAARIGCCQIVEHLLKYGAHVNCVCTSERKKGYAPLHFAIENGNKIVVTLLLSRGANVDAKAENDITALHIAAQKGYTLIAKELLKYGACTHSSSLKEGYTPLHFAIKAGHRAVVKLLLEHGAKVDDQDKDGKTTLYLAVEKECLPIVEDLLNYCPDVNNQSNRNSLKIAVYQYGLESRNIVNALLEYGLIVNPADANNPELLHQAVVGGYLEIVEDLLKYGANVNTLRDSPFKGFTPLHRATQLEREEIAKLLISYEADINAQDETGRTPLSYAIKNANLAITKLLLTNRINVKDRPELLNIAIEKKCIEIIEVLLQHDVDINASDEYGRTALHLTVFSQSENSFGWCTNDDADITNRAEIAKLLLSKGANVNSQTLNGVTTPHAATRKGYAKVVEALFEYNANANSVGESGITPLHLSAQNGNKEITSMLLNNGADVNAKQEDGFTPLHHATQKGYKEIVKLLLECGAKVDSKIKNDITPLHLAAKRGYQQIIAIILKFGADIDCRDEGNRTALHIASYEGHNEVVAALLEYGSDINITSRDNRTPLDHAMAGLEFWREFNDLRSNNDHSPIRGVSACQIGAQALKCHIVKLKTANLYVSEKNLLSMSRDHEMNNFRDKCEKEIAGMKSEKINNATISFYDILAKRTRSLAIYTRNENIMQVLESNDYKTKFPMYASMIESNFRKSMERKELLEQGNNICHCLFNNFPELPYDCIEKIFNYLSDEEMKILLDACKLSGINNPNTNIDKVAITSYISHL